MIEICEHLKGGSSLGMWTKTTKRAWHRLIDRSRTSGKPPETLEQFNALHAQAKLAQSRKTLLTRWQRQVTAAGGPDANSLGAQPEKNALQVSGDIRARLDWHQQQWLPVLGELSVSGFQWDAYSTGMPMDKGEFGEIARFRQAIVNGLEILIRAHRDALRLQQVDARLGQFNETLRKYSASPVAQRLMSALSNQDASTYAEASRDVSRLAGLQDMAVKRRTLIARLEKEAAVWASLIRSRTAPHDATQAPEDIVSAWRWKQLSDELERRTQISIHDTQSKIEDLERELRDVTAKLVECKAWASKKQRVDLKQQAALEGYVTCLQKMTKSGRGKRDAALMAAAREHLNTARSAVPVWIMPLSRVYESFFPKEGTTRFDVVIIDEASQSDVSALAALYLGEKAIIDGDEEQVTPTPFADLDQVQRMITSTLTDIPNRELYDPETSVYHLARAFFKERILLREHFRSVPEIVQFSNDLSYDRHIKPLRESVSAPIKPPLVAHRVKVAVNDGKVNIEEAEEIAALVMACIEQPEYETNDLGEPSSFGVISLLGDEQAEMIDSLLRARMSPVEFEKRRIICGNAAQFQGDERDVMFLSLVDAGDGTPQPMRGFGPKEIFRKRYNVAASRARNQMWIVHSLDPAQDLQPGDLRRRLIEHALNPSALMGDMEVSGTTSALQRDVQEYLTQRKYRVSSQWPVGSCRIGLVVRSGKNHLAVECDGDRALTREELERDMERQATLERLGWRFARVRGSVFYRDADRAMKPVLQALEQNGVQPAAAITSMKTTATPTDAIDRVRRRAPEIRWMWSQRTKQQKGAEVKPAEMPVMPTIPTKVEVAAPVAELPPSPPKPVGVEVGDWVEFILVDVPADKQYVNIVAGPTDVDQSAISADEPLAKALLGHSVHEISMLDLGDIKRELEVLQIHKPRKHHGK